MENQKQTRYQGTIAFIKEMGVLLLIVFLIRTFGFGLYIVPTGSMETTMLVGERFFADKFTILFAKPQRGAIISLNDPTFAYSENKLNRFFQQYVWGPMNVTKRIIGIPGDHVKGVIEDGKPVVYLNDQKLDEPYLNKYPLLLSTDAAGNQIHMSSFDPSVGYEEQPFYDVNKSLVLKASEINVSLANYIGPIAQAADGALLLEPGQPIALIDEGGIAHAQDNYWTGTDIFDVHLRDNEYWLMGDNRRGSKDCRAFGPVDGGLIHGKIIFRIWSLDSNASWWFVELIKHPISFWSHVRWDRCMMRVQ